MPNKRKVARRRPPDTERIAYVPGNIFAALACQLDLIFDLARSGPFATYCIATQVGGANGARHGVAYPSGKKRVPTPKHYGSY